MEGALGPEFRRDTVDRYAQPHRVVATLMIEADLNIRLLPVADTAATCLDDVLVELDSEVEPYIESSTRQASVWVFEANGLQGQPSDVWRLCNINRCIYTI
jgi:hypothetical protein